MMDSDCLTSGSSGSDEDGDGMWNQKPASNTQVNNTSRGSVRGLQVATAEGWLIQRARDMCSFAHDRYRQAVLAEAENNPQETLEMSFRVSISIF